MEIVAAGDPAPEFTLARSDRSPFTRDDLLGETTLFVFYPFAFSETCTNQLGLYDAEKDAFAAHAAIPYGVSCDATYSQRAFAESLGISMAQLSDFEPKGAACTAFGVLHPGGFPQRALVLVGPDGVVRWSHQADSPGDLPEASLVLDALAAPA